jgi:arginine utilization protein RocB
MDFQTLFKEAIANGGKEFEDSYNSFEEEVKILFEKNIITLPEATLRLLEFAADSLDIDEPTVVIAISGPYYPHISNALIKDGEKFDLLTKVNRVSKELFGVEYQSQAYFMGISDLSYASWVGSDEDVKTIKTNSPGWDTIYKIPFKAIQSLNSPVVNIGPWGKDLHKPTERVYKKDLLERIPTIISTLINEVLEQA